MKHIKRLSVLILALAMLLSLLPRMTLSASAAGQSGKCGDNLTWSLDNGVLTISGSGDMRDWDYEQMSDIPWDAFSYQISAVRVSEGVTSIGSYAFFCCFIESLTLPNSLKRIGESAFGGCSSLKSLTIPSGITSIGEFAFSNCSALTSLTVPQGIKTLEDFAFSDCTGLKSIVIPGSLQQLSCAFYGCSGLESAYIMNGVEDIDVCAFSGCSNLVFVTIPESVKSISSTAFSDCGNLSHIFFKGSEADWKKMMDSIYLTPTDPMVTATLHCQSDGPAFSDVSPKAYYYDAVDWAVAENITTGTGGSTFSPNKSCTRGQVVTFLWRAKGSPKPGNAANAFTDVKQSDYYYEAMLWAVENGITTGASSTTFAPGKPCTRAQVVTFLWRAQGQPTPKSTTHPFTDVNASAYYHTAMLWAVENGITTGASSTTFAPDKPCTRAQVVTFLQRAENGE